MKILEIANCRGKKPVLNDIKKSMMILSSISIEINECEGANRLKRAQELLWSVLDDEGYYVNNKNRLMKKK
jgi:hypothetical protein